MTRLDIRLESLTDRQLTALHLRLARQWLAAVVLFASCIVLGIWFDWRWFVTSIVPLLAAILLGGCISEVGKECNRRRIGL